MLEFESANRPFQAPSADCISSLGGLFGLSQTSDVGRVGAPSGSGEPEIELRAHERPAPQWFTLPNL
jgi:hypothetical protein